MVTSQYQALGTERFSQNQALFRRYTAVYRALKNHITTAVQPVFLSPLVDQLKGFGNFSALAMLQYLFTSYGAIDEIDLEENTIKNMEPYDPAEPLARLIKKLEKGREFVREGGQTVLT